MLEQCRALEEAHKDDVIEYLSDDNNLIQTSEECLKLILEINPDWLSDKVPYPLN